MFCNSASRRFRALNFFEKRSPLEIAVASCRCFRTLVLVRSVPASFVLLFCLYFVARYLIFIMYLVLSDLVICTTRKLIGQRVVWPSMQLYIAQRCRECVACQQSKILRHQVAPLQHFKTPDLPFSHVHVDLVGPSNKRDGFSYLMTIVDRFTRWVEAILLHSMTAVSCANAFILNWVSRYSAPSIITSDRSLQFTSGL